MSDNTNISTNAQNNIKFLHEWVIPFEKEINETVSEVRNGQTVQVTQKVRKEVPVKMALKKLTRREGRAAELFYGKEYNGFVSMGFLPRSIMINKHLNVSGGIMSEKEREELSKLIQRRIELEAELSEKKDSAEEVKKELRAKLYATNDQITAYNNANESVFSQTAETKAQNRLNDYLAYNLTYIERDGKYVPYLSGETFAEKEEQFFKLEESGDDFFPLAINKAYFYVNLFSRGVDSSEQFALVEEEIKAQEDAQKALLTSMAEKAQAMTAEEAAGEIPPSS